MTDPAAGALASLARPYAWTDGRTQPTVELAVEARVLTTPRGAALPAQRTSAMWTVTQLCLRARSVAEIAAHLDLPAGTIRVLLGDLFDKELVSAQEPQSEVDMNDMKMYRAVLDGLRSL